MEKVNRKIIVLALILALITSFFVYVYIKKETAKPETVDYADIYVAVKTIQPRSKILETDIKVVKTPRETINPRALQKREEIVGRMAKERIIEGEQILKDRLADEKERALAYNIPEGKRAVTINVNEAVEVANFIRPGDFVDIIITFDKEEVDTRDTKTVYPRITKVLFQNVQILGIGQEQVIDEGKAKELPKTVTLAVDLNDAEKLVYVMDTALFKMVLRPVGDTAIVQTPGVIRQDVVPDKGILLLPK